MLMIRPIRVLTLSILLALMSAQVHAQITTGTPSFGSFGGGPDVINLANLNSHLTIPIFHKPGRGIDFPYDLTYDTSVWYPVTSGSTKTWQPVLNWGWIAQTAIKTGYLSYFLASQNCDTPPPLHQYYILSNWVYHDPWGGSHKYYGTLEYDPTGCDLGNISTLNETAFDGSGYNLSATLQANSHNVATHTIASTTGQLVNAPLNLVNGYSGVVSTATDRNGNQITVNSTSSSATFTDTLGMTALTVSGSGTTTSPMTFTYTTSTSGSAQYQVNYTNYTVATNFGVSGIGEYKSLAAVPLVTSIVLPDGSQYTFTYEHTSGTCTPYSGTICVTARLASVVLPTGGTISYSYAGGNNGILPDGSAATLTRTTPDGVWIYAQAKGTGAASTTTITAPKLSYDSVGNDTVIQFQGIYETQRMVYQGSHTSGTLMQTINTCYNSATIPCTATAITLPISQRTVLGNLPGGGNLQSQHIDKFNAYGLPTESDDYDFATSAPYPLLRQVLTTYANPGTYLFAFPQTVTVKDGSGTIQSRQDTVYDQPNLFCVTGAPNHDDTNYPCTFTSRGNATSTTTYTNPAGPSGGITKNFTYDSTGNLLTAQLNCCQTKTWVYSTTTHYAYPDSVTSGTSSPQLTTAATYDLNMGLVLTTTDPNSLKTTLTYDNMGRTLTAQVGSLPATNYTYTDSGTWSVKVCSPVQGTNTACQKSILDNQGRTATTQLLDGSGTLYSATDTQYDALGRPYKTSNPYTGSVGYWTQTNFDAMGRTVKTTLPAPDSSVVTVAYPDNTSISTDPTGKQRKAVVDGLGRLTSMFEPDPTTGNTLTLQTSYTYNVFDQLTKVTQGSQTRTYVYDALGRILSSTTPEGGKICFGSVTGSTCNTDGYDSFNNLLKRTDARGVLTSYSYDTLNRLSQVSYNVGATGVPATSTVSLSYGLDTSCNSAHGAGCIGQIITMTDGPGSENYTYNSLEQLTQLQKVINGTSYPTSYAYNLAGELTQITYPSGRVIQQSVDAIGRVCEIAPSTTTCGSAANPYVTGYGYNSAGQVTGFKYGNGIFASLGFSPDRLQLSCLDYSTTNRNGTCIHDSTTKFGLGYSYGTPGSNNGMIASITDSVDSGRGATYSYDALYRLSTAVTTGSANYPQWGLSWGYDRYGNRLNQTLTAGSGYSGSVTVDVTTNRLVQTTGTTYAYDANGNMTSDNLNAIVYDAENHSVSSSGSLGSGTYTYDGNGLRVKKVSGSTTTVYIFSGNKEIAEYNNGAAPSSPSKEFIYAGSRLVANIVSGTTTYFHQDHLSNRLLTDVNGNVVTQRGHFPFGEVWYETGTVTKWKFTSYERDAESGNDYAIARNYVSRLGRFASPDNLSGDVANPQSLNRYSYVLNNPGNLVDPSGQCGEMSDTKLHRKRLTYGEGGRELDSEDLEDFLASQDIPIDPCPGTTGGSGGGGGGGGGTVDPLPSGLPPSGVITCSGPLGGATSCGNTQFDNGSGSGVGFSGPSLDNPYYNDPSNGSGIGDSFPIHSIGGPGGGGGNTKPLMKDVFKNCIGVTPNNFDYTTPQPYKEGIMSAEQHITEGHIFPGYAESVYGFVPAPSSPQAAFANVQAYNAQTFMNPDVVMQGTDPKHPTLIFVKSFPSDGSNGQNPLLPGVPAFIGHTQGVTVPLNTNVLILNGDCKQVRTSFPIFGI
jgi:RHS repeat-associated protein